MLKICLGKCALCVILFACCTQLAFTQTGTDQPVPAPEPAPPQPMIDPEVADRVDEILDPPSFDSRNSPFLSSLLGGQQPRRRGSDRLAKTPAVFGDLYNGTKRYVVNGDDHVGVDLPFTGAQQIKIAEHNSALPVDRVFFYYNHFHNAVTRTAQSSPGGPISSAEDANVDRYTFGFEKTFHDGICSIEIRMPFTGGFGMDAADLGLTTGHVGNLSVVFKRLVYETETGVAAVGIGVGTPTGSDVFATLSPGVNSSFKFHNQAVHLSPFFGFLSNPHERMFCQGFMQLDIETNGNTVEINDSSGTIIQKFHESPMLFVDLATGYWLLQAPENRHLTALAVMAEVHYNGDIGNGGTSTLNTAVSSITGQFSRSHTVNVTAGAHAELANQWRIRIAGVFPLDTANRFFDSELNAAVIRHY